MSKINSIDELKKFIENNYDYRIQKQEQYDYRIQKQEQYDDSPDYAYDDGVEDGKNEMLYTIGKMLGMDLQEMSEPRLCGYCGEEDPVVDVCEECGIHYCEYCGVEGGHICNNCKEEKENELK